MNRIVSAAVVLSLLPMTIDAQTSFGHWMTGPINDKAGFYAATVNESNDIFGEYCYFATKTCTWYVAMDSVCEKDHVYPVLGNTDQGAAPLELVCVGQFDEAHYSYAFRHWQDLERLVKTAKRVGLAMPMKEDQFQVHRFLLDGITASTKQLETGFFAAVGSSTAQPARNNSTVTSTL